MGKLSAFIDLKSTTLQVPEKVSSGHFFVKLKLKTKIVVKHVTEESWYHLHRLEHNFMAAFKVI